MELTCPSCEARYGVPDGAIGERGRQVSCSNCGHGWRAVRQRAPRDAAATAGSGAAAAPAAGDAAHPARQPGEAGQTASAEIRALHPSDTRIAQLAEIREMIAQVQSEDGTTAEVRGHGAADAGSAGTARSAPALSAGAAAGAAGQRTELRRSGDADDSDEAPTEDPLRRRMAEHDARAARERDERERLRRSMQDRRTEPASGSGAFLSGFLLVVLVAAVLLGVYAMRDEVVARAPQSEPMVTRYVDAVNDARDAVRDSYERARAWVVDVIADNV